MDSKDKAATSQNPFRFRSPGPPQPSLTLLELLRTNHVTCHAFFNDLGHHNHTAHTLLALHGMGATPDILKASFEHTQAYQKPAFRSPNDVTEHTWTTFLGDARYYSAYVRFFDAQLEKWGVHGLLEKYIFSEEANIPPIGSIGDGPQMLSRMLDSLQHPLIHIGSGLEFHEPAIPGKEVHAMIGAGEAASPKSSEPTGIPEVTKIMLVEGLAQTALHKPSSSSFLPVESFLGRGDSGEVGGSRAIHNKSVASTPSRPLHALTILARVLSNPVLGNFVPEDPTKGFLEVAEMFGDVLHELVDTWIGDAEEAIGNEDPNVGRPFIRKKVEELVWAVTLIFGVGGYQAGRSKAKFGFNADFFLVHLVTGTYFIPSFVDHLTPRSSLLLLRGYFGAVLCTWVARNRPRFDREGLRAFFNDDGLARHIADEKDTDSEASWDRIKELAVGHLDEHVPKIQRSLSYFAELLGNVEGGVFMEGKGEMADSKHCEVELEGADYVDGSLFLRTSILCAKRVGVMENLSEHVLERQRTFVWDLRL